MDCACVACVASLTYHFQMDHTHLERVVQLSAEKLQVGFLIFNSPFRRFNPICFVKELEGFQKKCWRFRQLFAVTNWKT